jgi:hypothetical protein
VVNLDKGKIANWVLIIFVLVAVFAGLAVAYLNYNNDNNYPDANAYVILVSLILGIIAGLMTIIGKTVTPFLIGAVASCLGIPVFLIGVSMYWLDPITAVHGLPFVADWIEAILTYIIDFVAPAAVIIVVKAAFAIEKPK